MYILHIYEYTNILYTTRIKHNCIINSQVMIEKILREKLHTYVGIFLLFTEKLY